MSNIEGLRPAQNPESHNKKDNWHFVTGKGTNHPDKVGGDSKKKTPPKKKKGCSCAGGGGDLFVGKEGRETGPRKTLEAGGHVTPSIEAFFSEAA